MAEAVVLTPAVQDAAPDTETLRALHRTIRKVTEDTDGMRFNIAISAMMEFRAALADAKVQEFVGGTPVKVVPKRLVSARLTIKASMS